MTETELLNFRIPTHLKQRFQDTCKNRNVAMTSALNQMIVDYVANDPTKSETRTWEPILFHAGDHYDDS